jgi:phospholipid transport system substrate-binding protein
MTIQRIRVALVTLGCTLALAAPAAAGAPTDALRGYIDRAFALLGDGVTQGARPAPAQRDALRALAHEALDFRAAARQTLGPHWDARTPEERARFVQLFTALIDRAYLSDLRYDGVRMAYDGERTAGTTAEVRARAVARNGDVTPVMFSLHTDTDARWRVVDVSFEGMSLVGSYRAQFGKILRTSSYAEMVSRLEAKTRAVTPASATTDMSPSRSAP